MEKMAPPDEILARIRGMLIADREYVEAELMRDAYASGRIAEPAEVMEEIMRRANAVSERDPGLSREQSVARARLAALQARRQRP
jgi:hypothetical protein